jgi:hypothetical protein
MKLKLPKIAEALVQASNDQNLEEYGDVGKAVKGKKAIADWFTNKDYEYRMEPLEVEEAADKITVKTKVTGTFKGSPLNFSLQMKLDSGLIQNLKIDVI